MNTELKNRDVVFGHFDVNSESNKRAGHLCVALLRPPKNSTSTEFQAAVAFGSPLDSPNRRLARQIALGRLKSARDGRNFKFSCKSKNLQEVFKEALKHATSPDLTVEKLPSDSKKKSRGAVPYAPLWLREAMANRAQVVPSKHPVGKKELHS